MLKSSLKKISALGLAAFACSNLSAATFTVNNNQDSGAGSLRQAITDANAGGGGDIVFSNVTGVITLSTNLPLITASMNILGPGTNVLTVSGNNSCSIFQVASNVSTTLSGFTMADSYTATQMAVLNHGIGWLTYPGSAISNAGAMTVQDCVLSNCVVNTDGSRMVGGAIYSSGTLSMQNCLVVHCGSTTYESGLSGGAIYSSSGLTLNNCCFSNCLASDVGGVIAGGTNNVFNNCLFVDLGYDDKEGNGGAIEATELVMNSCVISDCDAGWEGGAFLGSGLTAYNSSFLNCGSGFQAGGLDISGTNFFYNCTVSQCQTDQYGGGGIQNFGISTFVNCTICSNSIYDGQGAGIYNAGTINLTNCTLSGNSCQYSYNGGGAAIFNTSNTVANLTDCTIVSNTGSLGPGNGIANQSGGTVNVADTIIANNTTNDFVGVLNSLGHNLIKNTAGCTIVGDQTGNVYGVDPLLGPLQNNGGLTMTHALLAGSPAIDAGPTNAAPNFDQRGLARPNGAADDIGAFEFGAVPFPAVVSLAASGANCFHVNVAGSPLVTYTVFRAASIAGPWTAIGAAATGCDGNCLHADTNAPAGSAFYRAVYQPQ